MSGLIIYFILTSERQWEFFAIQRTDVPGYCEYLQAETKTLFANRPGNIRILCADDQETDT